MIPRLRAALRMDALVSAYAKLGRFSGAVLVARGPKPLFARAYGNANYEHGVPNTVNTPFRIGSQTKSFTAIAVLLLREEGRLSVTDPIARYLPDYPRGEEITIHHLLTNTSGIPDYITAEGFTAIMGLPRSLDQVIASFRDQPLLFRPGERMSYSNSGWILLGAIIERVTGEPYGDHIAKRILTPLGMRNSGLALGDRVLTGHADGYVCDGRQVSRVPRLDNSNQHAAGGLHSTVLDLHRWNRGLHGGRLLRQDSLRQLLTPHVEAEGGAYGYGFLIGTAFGRERVETSGGTIGFVSTSTFYPADDLFVTVLSNIENGAYAEIEHALAAIAFGEPYEPPTGRVFVTVDPAIFDRYLGRYTMTFLGRTATMDVTRDGDRLMAEVHGLNRTELRPMSPTRYFARMKGEVELDFVVDGDRPAQRIAMNWAGHAVTAKRVAA